MIKICLGSAFGDALGAPFEVCKKSSKKLIDWDGKSFHSFEGHKFLSNLKPGDTTDDFDMTRLVVKSLIKNKSFNPESLAQDYVDWLFGPNSKGYGKTTEQALNNLKSGIYLK